MTCPRGINVGGSTVVCVVSALLFVLPAIHGYQSAAPASGAPQFDDLPWTNLEDDSPPSRPFDNLLYLPRQTMGVERAKRTGLGGMGGPLGGLSVGGGVGGGGPSLSIVAPLDVLRQRVMLEMIRRRMRESEGQIQANREMLNSVGKRAEDNATFDLRRPIRDTSRKSMDDNNNSNDHNQHSRVSPVL